LRITITILTIKASHHPHWRVGLVEGACGRLFGTSGV
jgi:hypothetical protein